MLRQGSCLDQAQGVRNTGLRQPPGGPAPGHGLSASPVACAPGPCIYSLNNNEAIYLFHLERGRLGPRAGGLSCSSPPAAPGLCCPRPRRAAVVCPAWAPVSLRGPFSHSSPGLRSEFLASGRGIVGVTAPPRWRLPCLPAATDTRAPTPLHVAYFRVFRGLGLWVGFCFCLPSSLRYPTGRPDRGGRSSEEQAGMRETRGVTPHASPRVSPHSASFTRPPRARGRGGPGGGPSLPQPPHVAAPGPATAFAVSRSRSRPRSPLHRYNK